VVIGRNILTPTFTPSNPRAPLKAEVVIGTAVEKIKLVDLEVCLTVSKATSKIPFCASTTVATAPSNPSTSIFRLDHYLHTGTELRKDNHLLMGQAAETSQSAHHNS
jgi:hypothetical protein